MRYRESTVDKENRKWFANDHSKQTLAILELYRGVLRGLSPFKIIFNYPITAIAGKNGSGKSTLLAMAACGFHNKKNGFKFKWRKYPYYTFSDFFIQAKDEVPPQGISIRYGIKHDSWRVTPKNPNKERLGYQSRTKNKGGRWNDYASRVDRDVVFFGIERVVPHSEKSVSKSYRKAFKKIDSYGWENDVRKVVGKILNKKYDSFEYVEYSKYRLPFVESGNVKYSGFNMGAGENALFEIFSTIYSCKEGALLIIDEIELGLHIEAQKKLVKELKQLCNKRKIQIICTTHSKHIFEELPLDARFFIESIDNKTVISEKVSSELAFGKLAAVNSKEIDIFVEDKTAFSLTNAFLPSDIRNRVNIEIIGSASALARQMASIRKRKDQKEFLVIFDGDQKCNHKSLRLTFLKTVETYSEKEKEEEWFDDRVTFLPGTEWPERWILQESLKYLEPLSGLLKTNSGELSDLIEVSLQADKHSEFYEMSEHINVPAEFLLDRFSVTLAAYAEDKFQDIVDKVKMCLP